MSGSDPSGPGGAALVKSDVMGRSASPLRGGHHAPATGRRGNAIEPIVLEKQRAIRRAEAAERLGRVDPTDSKLMNVSSLQMDVAEQSSQAWLVERDLRDVEASVSTFQRRNHEAGNTLDDLQLRLQHMRAQMQQSISDTAASAPKRRRGKDRDEPTETPTGASGGGDGFNKSLTFGLLAKREAARAARLREEQAEKAARRRRRRRADRRRGDVTDEAGDGAEDDGPGLEEMEKRAVRDVREGVDEELEAEEMQLYESCFLAPAEEEGEGGKEAEGDDLPPWLRGDDDGGEKEGATANVQNSRRDAARTKAEKREAEKKRRVQKLQRARVQALPPQAPPEVWVGDVTATTIALHWRPPVFDGGAKVIDYEIAFSTVSASREGKRVTRVLHEQPVRSTLCFVRTHPSPGTSYTFSALSASSEYAAFSVRARNTSGYSPWTEPLGRTKTRPPEPPGQPRHVYCSDVTGQSFALRWAPPRSGGGCPIVDYEVTFELMQQVMVEKDGMRRAGGREVGMRTIRTGGARWAEATELEGDARHWNIRVTAISSADLTSGASDPIEVRTREPTRLERLQHELRRAKADPSEHIDSAFHTGVVQRWTRVEYIETLKAEMETLGWSEDNELAEAQAAKERATAAGAGAEEGEDEMESLLNNPTSRTRYHQFRYRIEDLGHRVEAAKQYRQDCTHQRGELMGEVQRITTRMRSVKAELDRAQVFQGPYMDSHVLHSRVQRFPTEGLRDQLARDYHERLSELTSVKRRLMGLEDEERRRVARVEAVEERLKDRRAAFKLFCANVKRTARAGEFLGRMRLRPLFRTFAKWTAYVEARRQARALLTRVLRRASKQELSAGFSMWRQYLLVREREEQEAADAAGVGTRLLSDVHRRRAEMEEETNEIIARLSGTATTLQQAAYTADQWREVEDSAYWKQLTEARGELEELATSEKRLLDHKHIADAHYRSEQWEEAARHYGAHADRMRDKRNGPGCTEALVGMAACYCHMGRYERALIAGDQCLLMSSKLPIGTKSAEADALYWVGVAHSGRGRYREASRSLLRSMRTHVELQDRRKEGRACKELARVFGVLREDVKANVYEKRAQHIEREFYANMEDAAERLSNMESRLVGVSAEVGKALTLERMPRRVPVLRSQWAALRGINLTMSTEKDLLERDVWNVDQRLEVMNGQLERAHNARTGKYGPGHLLWSKKRQEKKSEDGASSAGDEMSDAEKRITQEIQEQERIKRIALSEAQSREIRIRNVEDEMKQIEEELRLETGELARRVHIQRPLRAVAFNKMNAQTSDVFGTETAGVELFAATMHSDVAFYDLETAVCMSVLGGGDPSRLQAEGRNGHPQAITAVHFTSDILITGDVSGAIRTWILADTLAHEAAEVDDQAGEEESKKKKKKKQAGGKRQEGNHAARPPGNVRVELDYERGGVPSSIGAVRHFADEHTMQRIVASENPARQYQLLEGHTGSVWSLDSTDKVIVSGSADQTARVWSRRSMRCLRVITGHRFTVRSVVALPSGVVTAGQDGTIRVWRRATEEERERERGHARNALQRMGRLGGAAARVEGKAKQATSAPAAAAKPAGPPPRARSASVRDTVQSMFRTPAKLGQCFSALRMAVVLKAHTAPLTCVEASPVNVVSGDEAGEVIVWDLSRVGPGESGVARRLHVHEGSVLCLQFDELKVVSGGRDGAVVVMDILTGRRLQTLRGHESPVIALQYDHIQLLTCSMDGAMRQWHITSRDGGDAFRKATDKFHIVAPGESIYDLANRYRVDIRQIMAWNALKDPKSELYGGRRVIVRRAGVRQQFAVDPVFGKVSQEAEDSARLRHISNVTSPLDGVLMRMQREERERKKEEEERQRRERDRLAQQRLNEEEEAAKEEERADYLRRMEKEVGRASAINAGTADL